MNSHQAEDRIGENLGRFILLGEVIVAVAIFVTVTLLVRWFAGTL